ncbi:MAG: tetratricopeptide repeat protein [Betaproteobacteria bacterium]
MKNLATLLLVVVTLAGCAIAPVDRHAEQFFRDSLFQPPTDQIDARQVFALSAEMLRYLDDEIARPMRVKGRQRALVDALYNSGELKLQYDTESTRNAAQAFAARSGNCLSLVIMTAAFAKELGLAVEYQKVVVDDTWSRSGDIYLAIGHVNLTLGRRATDVSGYGVRVGNKPAESDGMTIDFLPPADMRSMRTRAIGEDAIVSMYMNNRAVEALTRGEIDNAYWWAREAITQSPDLLMPYNTLGAIYRRHGNPREAESILAHVLEREPSYTQAMSNQVLVLHDLGRAQDAQRLAVRLQQIDPEPAFSHFNRGLAAMQDGNARAARDAFAMEVARAPDYHEFHFWLALAYYNLGEFEPARTHLTIAMKSSTTHRDHDLYAAKLDRLNRP